MGGNVKYLIGMILVLISFLAGLNVQNLTSNFFEISLFEVIYIVILIYISFYLTQKKEDERKLKEKSEDLLYKLNNIISDQRFIQIETKDDVEYVNQQHQRISNIINTLQKIKISKEFNLNIDVILSKIDQHRNIIGNHINDVSHLNKCKPDFIVIISVIKSKVDDSVVEMYILK